MFWVHGGEALQNPLSRAAQETVTLKLKDITDPTAKAVIGGQRIQIQGLIYEQESARQFIGYMVILSVSSIAVTLLLMVVSASRNQKCSK